MNWRAVHINGFRWKYKVGRRHVIILSPSNERKLVPLHSMLKTKPGEIERMNHKGVDWGVKPGQVKGWIQRNYSY